MKILILYASRGGATRKCAEMLKDGLSDRNEVTLCDVRSEDGVPSPSAFDVCVMGSCIRFARIDKKIKGYMRSNTDILSAMPSAFFFCCGFPSEAEDYIDTEIPKGLTLSLGAHCFGGELKPEKQRGFDKFIVKMVRGKINSQDFEESDADHMPLPELLPEAVDRLCADIRKMS